MERRWQPSPAPAAALPASNPGPAPELSSSR
nr:MAG TPA: hypothetical protein [Caudoviricetes sp.]